MTFILLPSSPPYNSDMERGCGMAEIISLMFPLLMLVAFIYVITFTGIVIHFAKKLFDQEREFKERLFRALESKDASPAPKPVAAPTLPPKAEDVPKEPTKSEAEKDDATNKEDPMDIFTWYFGYDRTDDFLIMQPLMEEAGLEDEFVQWRGKADEVDLLVARMFREMIKDGHAKVTSKK